MPSEIVKPTFTIKTGEGDDAVEFELRVPSPLEKAKIGVRAAAIRRSFDPTGMVSSENLDGETFFLIQGMAILETLLERSDAKWVWTEFKPDRGDPQLIVDVTKFPEGKETIVAEVGLKFQESLDRFHRDRAEHTGPAVP